MTIPNSTLSYPLTTNSHLNQNFHYSPIVTTQGAPNQISNRIRRVDAFSPETGNLVTVVIIPTNPHDYNRAEVIFPDGSKQISMPFVLVPRLSHAPTSINNNQPHNKPLAQTAHEKISSPPNQLLSLSHIDNKDFNPNLSLPIFPPPPPIITGDDRLSTNSKPPPPPYHISTKAPPQNNKPLAQTARVQLYFPQKPLFSLSRIINQNFNPNLSSPTFPPPPPIISGDDHPSNNSKPSPPPSPISTKDNSPQHNYLEIPPPSTITGDS